MNKFIRFFICFFVFYTPFFANAAKTDWAIRKLAYEHQKEINEPVVAIDAVRKLVSGAEQTTKVKVPVSAGTLGSSVAMLIRGGLAGAAVIGLIEGVGWIIENGVVKKKEPDGSLPQYMWCFANKPFSSENCFLTPDLAKAVFMKNYPDREIVIWEKLDIGHWYLVLDNNKVTSILSTKNPKFDENKEPNYIQVSDTEIGEKILDSPAAPKIIPDVYNPNQPTKTPARDASSDALDKAIPDSDPNGTSNPKPNKDTDGDGKPDVHDPSLPNQGFDFQIPKFCDWASVLCVWYEKYSEDSKKTDQHREDEKSLWQKVEDWFDWTKEEPEKPEEPETPQVDDKGIFDRTFDTAFSLSSQCPSDIPINFESRYISGKFTFSMNWLCIIFSFIAYPLVFLSHCVGIWILYETVIQKEIKW